MLTLAIAVITILLGYSWGRIRNHYARLRACHIMFHRPELVKYMEMSPDVREYFQSKVAREASNGMIWTMFLMFAFGDTILLWVILPSVSPWTPVVLGCVALIAAVLTRAFTIDTLWVRELIKTFNKAAHARMKENLGSFISNMAELDLAFDNLEKEVNLAFGDMEKEIHLTIDVMKKELSEIQHTADEVAKDLDLPAEKDTKTDKE